MTQPSGATNGFVACIPARFSSSRLPGKPLIDLGGKPMVVRVAERAARSGAMEILVATDHEGIAAAVSAHGYTVCMTSADHQTGTDRIAEVARNRGYAPGQVIVNVQGDEPLVEPDLIRAVANDLIAHPDAAMATACCPIHSVAEFTNPAAVKVVIDRNGYALYFSRAAIPHARDAMAAGTSGMPPGLPAYRHIGLYAYRAGFLQEYSRLTPSPLETFEALEQLRVLWHGFRICVATIAHAPPAGVDTPEDVERVRRMFPGRQSTAT